MTGESELGRAHASRIEGAVPVPENEVDLCWLEPGLGWAATGADCVDTIIH